MRIPRLAGAGTAGTLDGPRLQRPRPLSSLEKRGAAGQLGRGADGPFLSCRSGLRTTASTR
eukprot:scaffold21185_cov77-Isochrysis_galbana.AAC.1